MTGGEEGPFDEDEDGGFGVSHFDEVLLQFNTKVRNTIYLHTLAFAYLATLDKIRSPANMVRATPPKSYPF